MRTTYTLQAEEKHALRWRRTHHVRYLSIALLNFPCTCFRFKSAEVEDEERSRMWCVQSGEVSNETKQLARTPTEKMPTIESLQIIRRYIARISRLGTSHVDMREEKGEMRAYFFCRRSGAKRANWSIDAALVRDQRGGRKAGGEAYGTGTDLPLRRCCRPRRAPGCSCRRSWG